MGDVTEMILDGTLDYRTGEYLGEGCGFPRTEYSDPDPVFGVKNYPGRFKIRYGDMHGHCRAFLREVLEVGENFNIPWPSVAVRVQENWSEFVRYTREKLVRR